MEDCVECVEILSSWLGQLAGPHVAPNTCSPLAKMFLTRVSPSLAVFSNSLIMASAKLDGMKYVLLLRRPYVSWRARVVVTAWRWGQLAQVLQGSVVHRLSKG